MILLDMRMAGGPPVDSPLVLRPASIDDLVVRYQKAHARNRTPPIEVILVPSGLDVTRSPTPPSTWDLPRSVRDGRPRFAPSPSPSSSRSNDRSIRQEQEKAYGGKSFCRQTTFGRLALVIFYVMPSNDSRGPQRAHGDIKSVDGVRETRRCGLGRYRMPE